MILITGLPNAGKTTLSLGYSNVIHLDDIGYDAVLSSIEGKQNVIIEGAYGSKKRIDLLRHVTDVKKICVYIDTEVEECIKREYRGRNISMLRLYANQFEPPTYDEGWDEIIIVKDGKETLLPRQEV